MRSADIPKSVKVDAPSNYKNTYTSDKDPSADTWSWYAAGEDKQRLPHFTVGMRDEGPGGWFRFHVTIPIASGTSVANAHLFYIIKGSQVSRQFNGFCNAEELSSGPRGVLETMLQKDGQLLDDLARSFYRGASQG